MIISVVLLVIVVDRVRFVPAIVRGEEANHLLLLLLLLLLVRIEGGMCTESLENVLKI
jgi:hypothetical protein